MGRQNFIQGWRAQCLNDVHCQKVALHKAPSVRPCRSSASLHLCCGITCLLILTPVACHDQPPDSEPACFIRLPRISSDIADMAGPPLHGCPDEMRIIGVSSLNHGCLHCWRVAICIDGKKMCFDRHGKTSYHCQSPEAVFDHTCCCMKLHRDQYPSCMSVNTPLR